MGITAPVVNNLSELLARHVQERPEEIAIGTSDLLITINYGELDSLIWSTVVQLRGFGVQRGNTVALVSDNSVEFVIGFLAVVSAGACIAPLNPSLSATELGARLADLAPHAVLVPRHLEAKLETVNSIPKNCSRLIMDFVGSGSSAEVRVVDQDGDMPRHDPINDERLSIDANEVALLMFTGGTTGVPKLVPLTHRNITASMQNIATGYALSPSDRTLLVMPLFHGHGLIAGLLSTLATGGGAYLPSTGAFSAHLFWPDVVRTGVTWYTAVPTIHRILFNRAFKEYPQTTVPLRFIRSCSAPLDDELANNTTATFHAPLISAYGMTETAHQVSSNPLPGDGYNKMSSVGLAKGVEIRVVDEEGRDVATGSVGEIWIKGARVTAGYLNNPQANAASFVDDWFRTGDLGSRDSEGYIFLKGRIKEMINRGGEKIAPSDIDTVLLCNPKVLEAASFGEADSLYGEVVQAAVILRPGMQATEDELREYSSTRLSAFEVPERIFIVSDFPRTAKGSTDRQALAAQFAPTMVH